MTTEVLRNMLLTGSALLDGLGVRGPRRGPLPPGPLPGRRLGGGADPHPARGELHLPLGHRGERPVLGEWLESVRGPTTVIVERHRPIDAAATTSAVTAAARTGPKLVDLLDRDGVSAEGRASTRPPAAPRGRPVRTRHRGGSARPAVAVPRSPGAPRCIELLEDADMLPGDRLHLQPGRRATTPCASACATGCAWSTAPSAGRSAAIAEQRRTTSATTSSSALG